MNLKSQEAKELGTVSRPWRRGYSVPNLNANATANTSSIQRPSGEELMNLRLRKVRHDDCIFLFSPCPTKHAWSTCMTKERVRKRMSEKY